MTLLEGTSVTDAHGLLCGKVVDVAVATGSDAGSVVGLILKTPEGRRLLEMRQLTVSAEGEFALRAQETLQPIGGSETFLLLRSDLVDRQIIDVHGRKVVRVNDVDLSWHTESGQTGLHVTQVEVGMRGAMRRLLRGALPAARVDAIARRFPPRIIPWEFVDVIEVDPARRVRLKIEHARLAQLHPSDIADILEDLAPAEREAVFHSLGEEVAADALEEVEPRLQRTLIASLDSERVADIVEEMDPGAAADLLAELSEERSDAILDHMEPEERQEVEELLEFREDSAAGRMTTDFVAVPVEVSVAHAIDALRDFEGDRETVTAVYLIDEHRVLKGAIPLARLLLAEPATQLSALAETHVISCRVDTDEDDVSELFDKYNLHALPVLDAADKLVGVVEADHVIAFLRQRR
ncbi:MAG: magnesium transporter MgtE N-terminal domain-containing protein [Acidobacteriaceae bacterium]